MLDTAPQPDTADGATRTADLPDVSIVVMVNRQEQFELARATFEQQSGLAGVTWIPVNADKNGWNAATALNHGLAEAATDWVICAHQDILYPDGWWARAWEQIRSWPDRVAIAGLVGVRNDGQFRGHVLDPHGHARWGPLPAKVGSLDEHLLIIDRRAGVRFDPETPSFHCYGTDIVREAINRGYDAIAIDAPVVHTSGGTLDPSFHEAAQWLLAKWRRECGGVLPTCATTIKPPDGGPVIRRLLTYVARRLSLRAGRSYHGFDPALWTERAG